MPFYKAALLMTPVLIQGWECDSERLRSERSSLHIALAEMIRADSEPVHDSGTRQECSKRVGERILGRRDIAGTRGEVGYELAIALPRRVFGRPVYVGGVGHITQIGRTSTVP
jgi:hypothetical protein